MEQGFIQIYTGRGKGKTTAAMGLSVRAIGHGLKVGFVYFYKSPELWGNNAFKVLEEMGVEVRGFAEKHPDFFEGVAKEDMREQTLEGLKFVEEVFEENSFDLLVLDEIIISVRDGFLEEDEILEILDKKPKEMELVLTGRGATDAMVRAADLVSRVKKVKHYLDKGVEKRPGIEY